MLNKASQLHRRKVICGGKVMYITRKFSGGRLQQVTRVRRLGRSHIRPHHSSTRSESVKVGRVGGSSSKRSSSHSVQNSILKSLSKARKGGTLARYA